MAEKYGRLFVDVQLSDVFGDGKIFVDAVALQSPEYIRTLYDSHHTLAGEALVAFVRDHFVLPEPAGLHDPAVPQGDVLEHVEYLWPQLTS